MLLCVYFPPNLALQDVLGGFYSVVQTKPWWPGDEQPNHKDVIWCNDWSLQELMGIEGTLKR